MVLRSILDENPKASTMYIGALVPDWLSCQCLLYIYSFTPNADKDELPHESHFPTYVLE
jgi:hypothetical protein